MRILVVIAVLSFLALAWATWAIARHIRRTASATGAPTPTAKVLIPALSPALSPDHGAHRYATAERHDRLYSTPDSGNLQDPGPRAHTRPRRSKSKP